MRKIFFLVFLLINLAVFGQEPPYNNMKSNYKFRGVRVDSLLLFPVVNDTTQANTLGMGIEGNTIRVGNSIFVRFAQKWNQVAGGGPGGGVTSVGSGYGLTGGPITGVGTLVVDTSVIATKDNIANISKVDSINKVSDSVLYWINGVSYFAFVDGGGGDFVPYTGATQNVDLGGNALNASNIKVNGTNGAGHIDLKHQNSAATAQGNTTAVYADADGYMAWQNNNLYRSTLAMPQTDNRVYTFQDKSYTLADDADLTLQGVTDNGSVTTNEISVDKVNIYDGANDNYGYLEIEDNMLILANANGQVLGSDGNGVYLYGDNTATISSINLTAPRTYYLPDTTGTILLAEDTASMLSNYAKNDSYTLNAVASNGNRTAQNIGANGYYMYDVANDLFYDAKMWFSDDEFRFDNNAGQTIMALTNNNIVLGDGSRYATINANALSTSRAFTFPDKAGQFILDSDTAAMLSNYLRATAFPVATFGAGSGAAGDTAAFTTSAYYGSFYNSTTDTIVVTAIDKAILVGSVSDTLFYNTTLTTSGATAIAVGTKIPPGKYVFSRTPAITTKPTYLSITLIGYRKR